jgi:hypothetical protein
MQIDIYGNAVMMTVEEQGRIENISGPSLYEFFFTPIQRKCSVPRMHIHLRQSFTSAARFSRWRHFLSDVPF